MFNYGYELTALGMTYNYAFWKHSMPPALEWLNSCRWPASQGGPTDQFLASTLLIGMVRLPYFWLRSMLRQPYEVDFARPDPDPSSRLRSPVWFRGRSFGSLAELWNAYYDAYERYLERFGAVYVRLEDLVSAPHAIVAALGRHVELTFGGDIDAIVERIGETPAKVHGSTPCLAGAAALDEYRIDNVRSMFLDDDLSFVNERLDAHRMRRFGYPIVDI